jgi:hypothetical protein
MFSRVEFTLGSKTKETAEIRVNHLHGRETFEARVRATSHMRLRVCDHYTSSTLIGGKGGVSPSTLHTTLEGPMEYANADGCKSPHGFLHDIE